jgi:methionine-gamma-lyase
MMLNVKSKQLSMESICAGADKPGKDPYGSHVMPLYQTSTFSFSDVEAGRKFFAHEPGGATHSYSRIGNPTVEHVERVLARLETVDLENDGEAMLFGSGMAAITTGFLALAAGKRIVAQRALYGCTSQFLQEQASRYNISVTWVNPTELQEISEALSAHSDCAMVYLESISNPTMRVCDLELITEMAHKAGALVMVDNTFATPWHIRPLNWGVDLVAYSTTKYLNGHGSVIGGALVAEKGFFDATEMRAFRKNFGGVSGPFDAWLTMMGLKTFPLRMKQHNANAMEVAEFLRMHPAVKQVWYPGDPLHPDADVIRKLMTNGYGGMIAFELNGGLDAGVRMMNRVNLCTLAVSLGTVDTLIQHPASMTHSVVQARLKEEAGITDGLVRLSVGIESIQDIISDLEQALS